MRTEGSGIKVPMVRFDHLADHPKVIHCSYGFSIKFRWSGLKALKAARARFDELADRPKLIQFSIKSLSNLKDLGSRHLGGLDLMI